MPDAVIAALAGVIVGALLNFGLTQLMERRREFLIARATARLVHRSLLEALLLIDDGQKQKRWPPGPKFQFKTDGWPQYRVELARVLQEDIFFDGLDDAFLLLDNENARIREGTSYDAERLNLLKVRTQGAVGVIDWLMKPRRERFKGEAKARLAKAVRAVSRPARSSDAAL